MLLLPLLFQFGCDQGDDSNPTPEAEYTDYKQEMRNLVQDISGYAKKFDESFIIIPQNGAEIVSKTGDDTGSPDSTYIDAIDGIGQESLFYGFDGDDQPTPAEERLWTRTFLDMARNNGDVSILVTDYAYSQHKMDESYRQNAGAGYISFAADHRELDNIPVYPAAVHNRNGSDIEQLSDAKNFLYLINPQLYSSRQALVDAVSATDYDLVIMDFFFNGEEFTRQQIEQLKKKHNGGRRLLVSYLSIGEAEEYRYYWQSHWPSNPPGWLREEDPNWAGNYYVEYWDQGWREIVFGNGNAYLDKIIEAGFDGAYLDIIDAFEYFESQDNQ